MYLNATNTALALRPHENLQIEQHLNIFILIDNSHYSKWIYSRFIDYYYYIIDV